MNATNQDALKRAAAAKALDYVENNMKLGLGTGSTAEAFLDVLAPRVRGGLTITGVATSERTAIKARNLGITVGELDQVGDLDLVVDGADETDADLNLIKGGGGAHLIEKIVAAETRPALVIACRALDRVIRAGRYWIPHWYLAAHRIAYWDVFGFPKKKPGFSRGIPDTWWYDQEKAAKLERGR